MSTVPTTTIHGFPRTGAALNSTIPVEPAAWDEFVEALDALVPTAANVAHGITAGTGVAAAAVEPLALKKITLTLTDVLVAVADADDYGDAELLTLPDRNLIFIACEADLELTKDGVGFIAGTDLDVAIGTAAASNTTLDGLMDNLLPHVDLNASDLTPALQSHSLATTPALVGVLDGAANKIYLNISGPTETSEDATVTATGTIDLYFFDLGNRTS